MDTDPVDLSAEGNTMFHGQIDALSCEPEQMIFLLRVADTVPGAPPIYGRWLAYGASRKIY